MIIVILIHEFFQEIYCIENEQTEESRLEVISHRKLPTSNFSALLAEQQLSEVQPATADTNVFDVNNLAGSTIAQVCDSKTLRVFLF